MQDRYNASGPSTQGRAVDYLEVVGPRIQAPNKEPGLNSIRIGDVLKLLRLRHPNAVEMLSSESVPFLRVYLSLAMARDGRVDDVARWIANARRWINEHLPALSVMADGDLAQEIKATTPSRLWFLKTDDIAHMLEITQAECDLLREQGTPMRNLASVERPKAVRRRDRKRKDKEAKEKERRRKGMTPQSESAARRQPWIAEGVSRTEYYANKAAEKAAQSAENATVDCFVGIRQEDAPSDCFVGISDVVTYSYADEGVHESVEDHRQPLVIGHASPVQGEGVSASRDPVAAMDATDLSLSYLDGPDQDVPTATIIAFPNRPSQARNHVEDADDRALDNETDFLAERVAMSVETGGMPDRLAVKLAVVQQSLIRSCAGPEAWARYDRVVLAIERQLEADPDADVDDSDLDRMEELPLAA